MNIKNIQNLIDDLQTFLDARSPTVVASCSACMLTYPCGSCDGHITPMGCAYMQAENFINDPYIITTRGPTIAASVRYYNPPQSSAIQSDCTVFRFNKSSSTGEIFAVYKYNCALNHTYGLQQHFWDSLDQDVNSFRHSLDSLGYFSHCIDRLKHELYSNRTITLNQIQF